MNRKDFLQKLGITIGVTSAGSCNRIQSSSASKDSISSINANPDIKWRMPTSWPKSLDVLYGGAETICQRVSEMTGGKFQIEAYPANEIVPALEVLDAVQKGTVECGHTASYYYMSKNLALAFGTGLPFGLNTRQQNAWLYEGGGLETMHKIYSDFNIINFPAGNTGLQMGGWFRKVIETVDDLRGLKMRIPGLGGEIMKRLGVDVRILGGKETYEALANGEIDAAEWVGPYDDEKLALHKTAAFYYYPGWWEPGTSFEVQINKSEWDKLPNEYQEIFKAACLEANIRTLAKYDQLNRLALRRLISDGIKLTPYSLEILESAQKIAFDLYDENAEKDAVFKQVYEQWKTFREQVYQWHRVNELSFEEFVFLL